jgi:hypothetical protein
MRNATDITNFPTGKQAVEGKSRLSRELVSRMPPDHQYAGNSSPPAVAPGAKHPL